MRLSALPPLVLSTGGMEPAAPAASRPSTGKEREKREKVKVAVLGYDRHT
jgi:hypothetical protein